MLDLQSRIDRLSEEEQMIRDSAASFFSDDAELKRIRAQRGEQPGYSAGKWQEMAELGWLGSMLPEQYGGMGLKFGEVSHIFEQMGRALAPEPVISTAILGAGAILNGDNEALKAAYLPLLASGEWKATVAWQEKVSSMSVDAESVVATADNGSYLITGKKLFVPCAAGADAFVVSAKTTHGTALFLVDKNSEGVSVEYADRVDGGFFGAVTLENVSVGEDRLVAAKGSQVLSKVLDEARLMASAELFGVMAQALEISVDYIKQREQFGKPIGSFQAIQHRAVDAFILVELSRSVLIQSANTFDQTADETKRALAASQVKARCSDAALIVTRSCIQLHGGIGYADECNIGLYLKKAMVLATWLGQGVYHRARYGELINAA